MDVKSLVSHPLVLRAAWRRVSNWYGGVEWVPQPEKAIFELHPQQHLERIGRDLAQGSFTPRPFPLIPYPKSGGALRHYTVPSVRDQVAFAVFGVLLGPLIDLATQRFAFGNRWYRGLVRDRTQVPSRWQTRPYALDSERFYLPYRRDYSLFRRSAAWTVSAMLGQLPVLNSARKNAVTLEDYADAEIPESCRSDWWSEEKSGSQNKRGVWARLDLQLAYPSVRLTQLRAQLYKLLAELSANRILDSVSGYPTSIVAGLMDPAIRKELARLLCDALERIEYQVGQIDKLWQPPHVTHDLPGSVGHGVGLPTGLAISGNLLHAYFYSLDQGMQQWMSERQSGQKAAFLRFADDIILIAETQDTLAEELDALWSALENDRNAVLSAPRNDKAAMNLRVNWSKVEPEDVAKKLIEYLRHQQWSPCVTDDACQRLNPPKAPADHQPTLRFAAWWNTQPEEERREWLVDDELRADRVGPFVTHLVERMSDLGTETLDDRFGKGAERRLTELHDLVRLRIEDNHVRADTRLAFAANRLASAFLPDEGGPRDSAELGEIRRSIGEAIRLAPWKFSLWRSVVQAACRRPLSEEAGDKQLAEEEATASEWLKSLLRRISMDQEESDNWLRRWPEKLGACCPNKGLRPLYLSFLRATFWRVLADALEDLHRVPASDNEHPAAAGPPWSSGSWTFRALDEKRASRVAAWLGNIKEWAEILYGTRVGPPSNCWWEVDALVLSVLRRTDGLKVVANLKGSSEGTQPPSLVLTVAEGLPGQLVEYLYSIGKLIQPNDLNRFPIGTRWAHYLLARPPRYAAQMEEAAAALAQAFGSRDASLAAERLGLARYLPLTAVAAPRPRRSIPQQWKTLDALQHNEAFRRHQMSHRSFPVQARRLPTLHRLLWVIEPEDGRPYIAPSEVPTVGLPVRVALRFLWEALRNLGEQPQKLERGPFVWILNKAGYEALRLARRQYLAGDPQSANTAVSISVQHRGIDAWEIPPHGAYSLPSVVQPSELSSFSLALWSSILLFFTSAQGSEKFLDALLRSWPSPVPLDERWELRSEIALPPTVWRGLDKALRAVLNRSTQVEEALRTLMESMEPVVQDGSPFADFAWDRVDVRLTVDSESDEIPMGCIPLRSRGDLPGMMLKTEELAQEMIARLAQITAELDWVDYREGFKTQAPPRIPRAKRQEIMRQIAAAFSAPGEPVIDGERTIQGPIVFPEVSLPLEEERAFFNHTVAQDRDALIGLQFQVVPSPYGSRRSSPGTIKYLANEAVFIGKVSHPLDSKVGVWRQFRIRKPLPTHGERALTRSLEHANVQNARWRMLPGTRWFRFLHPKWGDFTIAICSDLLDPSPWHSMQGKILHLLMAAFNKDVDLYDNLTWIRAYECNANIVGTNHGHYGGSFVWTPADRHRKEVARLRGNGLFVVADVRLDVRELAQNQIDGITRAEEQGKDEWEKRPKPKPPAYRPPPPGYYRRAK